MADAPVLGAGSIGVWVQVPSPAPDLRSVIRDELPAVFSLCSSTMSGFFISPPHVGMDCVLFKIPSQKAEDFSYRSIIPSLRKKSRLLRLCPCKHGHDASAALPTFCGFATCGAGDSFCLTFTNQSANFGIKIALQFEGLFLCLYPKISIHPVSRLYLFQIK